MAIQDARAEVWDFMLRGGWTFPVMVDADEAAQAYGVRPIPTLLVIDADGVIVKKIIGQADADRLQAIVDDLTG